MIQLHDVVQGSPEWHEARRGKYTGSNAYKLLGSFGASEYAKAIQSDFSGNFHTKRGHFLEDKAIELYEAISSTTVERTGYVTNDIFPDCLYSPDGLTDKLVLEVKCFGANPHMEIFNGAIPLKVLAQIHFGMLICGKRGGQLIIYNPDLDVKYAYKCIDIKYNRDIANNFRNILKLQELAHGG